MDEKKPQIVLAAIWVWDVPYKTHKNWAFFLNSFIEVQFNLGTIKRTRVKHTLLVNLQSYVITTTIQF